MKIVYTGIVKDTGLHIYNRKAFDKELESLVGKKVEICVQKKRKSRSVFQNAYYWGVVVPLVCDGLKDAGWLFGKQETHDLLKAKFLQIEKVNEASGEIIKSIGTTTSITTSEMMDYIASIQQWAAEFLGVEIPDPNQQIEIKI